MKELTWRIRGKRALAAILLVFTCGCGRSTADVGEAAPAEATVETTVETTQEAAKENPDPIDGESAEDGEVDLKALKHANPDIFGWMYISEGAVDAPILQNIDDDEYYITHDSHGRESSSGAIFTEYPNKPDFCDFNEVIYGVDGEFLRSYNNPDFFENNRLIDIYKEGDHLAYKVMMARKWPKEDLLTHYAFNVQRDCQNFLRDTLDSVSLSDNVDPGYKDLVYQNFLITLVTDIPDDADNQFMVIAALVYAENGTIDHPKEEISWMGN